MKKYNYEARDSASDKIVKSVVQADSENSAAKLLSAQGFVPLKIELQDDKDNIFAKLSGRITTKDKVVFTRQLATLIGAGLPLSQSLRTVQEQTANKRMQEIVQEIISDVEGGRSLSDSFSKHPEVFNKVYVALVAAGELMRWRGGRAGGSAGKRCCDDGKNSRCHDVSVDCPSGDYLSGGFYVVYCDAASRGAI